MQKFKINESLFPFKSQFVTLRSGSTIHYIDEGQGPTLLLLHGNPTWSFLYRKIIGELRNDFRCIAPDYPGFGLSIPPNNKYSFTPQEHAETLVEFLDTLDLKDITIMGQDWGGPIGFGLAQQEPQRIKGFVIGNTFAWPLEGIGQQLFSRVMGGAIGKALAWSCNGIIYFFMHRGVVRPLDKQTLEMYKAPFQYRSKRSPTYIFPRELRRAGGFLSGVKSNMHKLSEKPALIVWGEKDFAFKKYELIKFEQIFPRHKTILLSNAGHFIQEDAANEICEAIKGWMRYV